VRAFIQHNLQGDPLARKFYCIGPMFRHERPQKGRYRQFHQIDAEAFGVDDPMLDAEVMYMLRLFLERLFLVQFGYGHDHSLWPGSSAWSGDIYLPGKDGRMNDIVISHEFQAILRRWWLLIIFMLIGGLAGWIIGYFLPPIYEATAFYQVDLDKNEVVKRDDLPGIASLDYARSNYYLDPVAELFFNPEVQAELVSTAARDGISVVVMAIGMNGRGTDPEIPIQALGDRLLG
jgi:hypothetical protein